MKKVLARIDELRNGQSVNSLAIALEMAQTTLNSYLSGKRKPSIELIKRICANYQVSADWLLGLTDEHGGVSSALCDAEKAQMANKIHELEIKVATLENALSLVGGRRVPYVKTGGATATKTA